MCKLPPKAQPLKNTKPFHFFLLLPFLFAFASNHLFFSLPSVLPLYTLTHLHFYVLYISSNSSYQSHIHLANLFTSLVFSFVLFISSLLTKMDSDQQGQSAVAKMPAPTLSRYSSRIILKTIINRSDKGLGMVGERLVIGGWVKSSKELRKEEPLKTSDVPLNVGTPTDVTCVEVIQSRIPFLRSIIKVFGGHSHNIRDKLESFITKPPPPSISVLQISDGSCVRSLQVHF